MPQVSAPSTPVTVALISGAPGRHGGGRGGRRLASALRRRLAPRAGPGPPPQERGAGRGIRAPRLLPSFLPFPRRSTDPSAERAAASTVPPRARHGPATTQRQPPCARPLGTSPRVPPRPSAPEPSVSTARPGYLDPLLVSPAFRHVGRSARFLLTWSEQGRGRRKSRESAAARGPLCKPSGSGLGAAGGWPPWSSLCACGGGRWRLVSPEAGAK